MIPREEIYVVIPAYNEAPALRSTILGLSEKHYTIVVVDDGSSDATWAVLSSLPVIRIQHPFNLGQGAALQTAVAYALRHNAQIVVHFDADGQHEPGEISTMVGAIERGEADVVLGSRFLRESDCEKVPFGRRVLLKLGAVLSGFLTGIWLSDTHNGFRALSIQAARMLELKENGFAHATEILDKVKRVGLRYVEVPTCIRYTPYSRSKGQSSWNALNTLSEILLGKVFQ